MQRWIADLRRVVQKATAARSSDCFACLPVSPAEGLEGASVSLDDMGDRVVVNVGGRRFETSKTTLTATGSAYFVRVCMLDLVNVGDLRPS